MVPMTQQCVNTRMGPPTITLPPPRRTTLRSCLQHNRRMRLQGHRLSLVPVPCIRSWSSSVLQVQTVPLMRRQKVSLNWNSWLVAHRRQTVCLSCLVQQHHQKLWLSGRVRQKVWLSCLVRHQLRCAKAVQWP